MCIDIAEIFLLLAQRGASQIRHMRVLGEQRPLIGAQQPVACLGLPLCNVRMPLMDVFAQVTGTGRIGQPITAHVLLPVTLVPLASLDGLDGSVHHVEEAHAVLELSTTQPILGHLLLLPVLGLLHFQLLALTRLLQFLQSIWESCERGGNYFAG